MKCSHENVPTYSSLLYIGLMPSLQYIRKLKVVKIIPVKQKGFCFKISNVMPVLCEANLEEEIEAP